MTASGKIVIACYESLFITPNIIPKRYPETAKMTKIATMLRKMY